MRAPATYLAGGRTCFEMWSATVASVPMPNSSILAMRSRSDSLGGGAVDPCTHTHTHKAAAARPVGGLIGMVRGSTLVGGEEATGIIEPYPGSP